MNKREANRKVVNKNASKIGKTMRGTVKWFNVQKGYGFITGEDGNEYFIHSSNIEYGRQYNIGFDPDDEVEFTIIPSKGKNPVQAGAAEIIDDDNPDEEYDDRYEDYDDQKEYEDDEEDDEYDDEDDPDEVDMDEECTVEDTSSHNEYEPATESDNEDDEEAVTVYSDPEW